MCDLLAPTPGFSWPERFNGPEVSIQSQSWECGHGKHYEVVVRNKACGHEQVVHHTHSYSAHWDAMYDASERLVIPSLIADHGARFATVRDRISRRRDATPSGRGVTS